MTTEKTNRELVNAGFTFAKQISGLTPVNEIVKMIGDLATRLDVVSVRSNALAAENAKLKSGIGFFSYGSESGFEEHKTAQGAIEAAESSIDDYRGDACDGWSEEVDSVCWGVIIQQSTMTNLHTETDDSGYTQEICDYSLLPSIETPATDAAIHDIRWKARAEGIHFAANRMLAAWESGFVNDTPASVHDISGAVLSAVEFLPNADESEFKRDYADEVRARIRAGEVSNGI